MGTLILDYFIIIDGPSKSFYTFEHLKRLLFFKKIIYNISNIISICIINFRRLNVQGLKHSPLYNYKINKNYIMITRNIWVIHKRSNKSLF